MYLVFFLFVSSQLLRISVGFSIADEVNSTKLSGCVVTLAAQHIQFLAVQKESQKDIHIALEFWRHTIFRKHGKP